MKSRTRIGSGPGTLKSWPAASGLSEAATIAFAASEMKMNSCIASSLPGQRAFLLASADRNIPSATEAAFGP